MLKLSEDEVKKIFFKTDERRLGALIAEEVDILDFANKVIEHLAEKYGIEFIE